MEFIFQQINPAGKFFVEFGLPVLLLSSGLISALILIELLLGDKLPAVFRYRLWMSVPLMLAVFSVFGVVLFIFYLSRTRPLANSDYFNSASLDWEGAVFLIWLVVVCSMILFLLHRTFAVCRFVCRAKQPNALMKGVLWYCQKCMCVEGKVGLKVTLEARNPVVCGFIRPVILVPMELTARLGSRHLRSVLLHELAHIKRRDLWMNLLQRLMLIVYFYNPLLWAAERMLRKVRDEAADEMVMNVMGEKARWYHENLFNVSRLGLSRPGVGFRMVGVAEFKRRFRIEGKNTEKDSARTSKRGIPA